MWQRALPNGIDAASLPVETAPRAQSIGAPRAPCWGAANSYDSSEHFRKAQYFESKSQGGLRTQVLLSYPFPHFQFKLLCALAWMQDTAQDISKSCGDDACVPRAEISDLDLNP